VGTGSDRALPLLKGTLDLLVMKALSWRALHGFAIASWLETSTDGDVGVEDSALYQSLHRLEARGLVEADWGVTENNRRARYYRLTPVGRKRLREEMETWLRYTRSVTHVLTTAPRPA
jgi:transcriptional regulator